jgi:hypothetical protein
VWRSEEYLKRSEENKKEIFEDCYKENLKKLIYGERLRNDGDRFENYNCSIYISFIV